MRAAILVSPHTNEAAALCGATRARLTSQGWDIDMVEMPGELL